MAAKACDSLVTQQDRYIQASLKVEATADSLILLKEKEFKTAILELDSWKERYNNQVLITDDIKKQKNKWKGGSIAAGVLIILLLIVK